MMPSSDGGDDIRYPKIVYLILFIPIYVYLSCLEDLILPSEKCGSKFDLHLGDCWMHCSTEWDSVVTLL
jgi:hypothetical protein